MENEKKELQLEIPLNIDALQTLFADSVQIESNADSVILNFLQIFPGDSDTKKIGKIVARVALAWPHAIGFLKILNEHLKKNSTIAAANFNNQIKSL